MKIFSKCIRRLKKTEISQEPKRDTFMQVKGMLAVADIFRVGRQDKTDRA